MNTDYSPSFNLIQKPWIPVVTPDFRVKEVSLMELYETWEILQEIQADNPPTTLAIYRLLLAIMHRAYQGPRDEDHWEEILEDNGMAVIAYLKEHCDRFDLFHPDYPFMQDPILPIHKTDDIYKFHTMSTSQVFSHEHEWSGYSITLPQAARLLVRLQGFDITSLRAFYVGQTSGNRTGVNTPTINAANVLVRGSTLKNTLLFNLLRYDPRSAYPSEVNGDDLPAWETNSYAGKPKKTVPKGYISYLTFPWRRLRLFVEDGEVRKLAITMGNAFPDKVSPQQWESGIAYREGQPLRLSLNKQLWRDADSFIHSQGENYRPRIIDWLAELKSEEDLIDDIMILQVIGMAAKRANPLGWNIEQFSAPIQYITERDLAKVLKTAIAIAKSHQQVFGSFKGSAYFALAEELKNGDPGSLANALDGESRYWAELDRRFPELLNALPQDNETGADGVTRYGFKELPAWTSTVQAAARRAFTDSIQSIRNYQARAVALRTLERHLSKLRDEDQDDQAKEKAA